jgi:ABC-type transporter Mla MlaB component
MSELVTATLCDADGTWLISLHGDHDLASRTHLEQETSAIWPRCKAAVIDLSDVAFVDSGVIRWLLEVERQLEEAGAFTLSIVEGPPGSPASRLFRLLHMPHVLACYPTREHALAQVPAGTGPLAWAPSPPEAARLDEGAQAA